MKAKSVVLLSGGLDSTVNLYEAMKVSDITLVLTFNYGQRAAPREIETAQKLCVKHHLPHRVLDLPFVKEFGGSSLTDSQRTIPAGTDVDIHSMEVSQKTAKSVWVPNRNGIFLNIAAGFAESLGADLVIPGFNAEEAKTFPDNSEEFMHTMTRSLFFSTANRVMVQCYTVKMEKPEIVTRGIQLGVDFAMIWPCYHAGQVWCGQCESCLRSKHAFAMAGVDVATLPYESVGHA